MSDTRTIVVNGKTHTIEERRDGSRIEVKERDETGNLVAWYWRPAAPDAAVPMVPSASEKVTFRWGGSAAPAGVRGDDNSPSELDIDPLTHPSYGGNAGVQVDEAGRLPGCPMQHCEDMRLCGVSRRCVMSKEDAAGVPSGCIASSEGSNSTQERG